MFYLYVLAFLVSGIAAIFFILRSTLGPYQKFAVGVGVLVLLVAAYYFGGKVGVSPFSIPTSVGLGPGSPQLGAIAIGVAGAVLGTLGSVLFSKPAAMPTAADFLKPLSACPLTLIPVIKLIESAGEQNALSMLLLFCLSYQTGFFWERLLK
jgi:hypothetical protein